jgi:thiol:disulfide interchange protein|tara:strand:- start:109 stop:480 length:372 start_codon:yes stop_codon:yes gene_type:complete
MAVLMALFMVSPLALAGDRFEPYSEARLEAAQAEGRPVFIEVAADWCSTCKRQAPLIEALLAEPAFSEYVALKIDWDAEESAARALGAPRQSTLFVYKDGEQIAMSVAETNPEKLRSLLEKGL